MTPRLTNSKKWTPFPKDYLAEIKKVLSQSFAEHAQKGEFIAEGRIYGSEVMVRLGFLEKGLITQANAEVSVEYNAKKENVKKIIELSIDAAGAILQGFFVDGGDDLPRQWKMFEVEGKQVFAQFSTINTELESQADALLKDSDPDLIESGHDKDNLVKGEDNELEAEAMKKVFSEDD